MHNRPPSNFVKRDWNAPEYNWLEPMNRFEVYDGPAAGGIETNWQPEHGLLIDIPEIGPYGDGLDTTVEQAKHLRDSLTRVLEQLGQ